METHRKFKVVFGTTTIVASIVWERIEQNDWLPSRSNPSHLLFAFLFLRKYETEEMNAIISGNTEKTFRNWVHLFVPLVAQIQIVSTLLNHVIFLFELRFHFENSLHLKTEKSCPLLTFQEFLEKTTTFQLMELTVGFKNHHHFHLNIIRTNSKGLV